MWSALVVAKGSRHPNSGFYDMARRLRPEYASLDEVTLWQRELQRCYDSARG